MKTIRKYLSLLVTFCFVSTVVLCIGEPIQAASEKTIKTISVEVAGKKVAERSGNLQGIEV